MIKEAVRSEVEELVWTWDRPRLCWEAHLPDGSLLRSTYVKKGSGSSIRTMSYWQASVEPAQRVSGFLYSSDRCFRNASLAEDAALTIYQRGEAFRKRIGVK